MDLSFEKNSIIEIVYYTKKFIEVDNSTKEKFVDKQSRVNMSMFSPPPGLSSHEYSGMFVNHFFKSRKDANDHLEKTIDSIETKNIEMFQIGNQECIDYLRKIENSTDFKRWENPNLIEFIKHL